MTSQRIWALRARGSPWSRERLGRSLSAGALGPRPTRTRPRPRPRRRPSSGARRRCGSTTTPSLPSRRRERARTRGLALGPSSCLLWSRAQTSGVHGMAAPCIWFGCVGGIAHLAPGLERGSLGISADWVRKTILGLPRHSNRGPNSQRAPILVIVGARCADVRPKLRTSVRCPIVQTPQTHPRTCL